jgi:diadenosine tetraphosphate (Ap4A) HIT family hydrolase
MEPNFELHPRLAADTLVLGDLSLSRLLLMNDSRFPWCILVPRQAGLRELHDLSPADGTRLFAEIDRVSRALIACRGAYKLNVGALGNLVPQLHVHVVARQPEDAAWPGPVWGSGQAEPYPAAAGEQLAAELCAALGLATTG